ncbi:hypothetical protein [Clostridium intestinale]|uniref:TATA-box binding protein n=1 Tax=Clostridium intestinale TaxID=36845 RepID=A0A7D6VPP5_9CLOT|nr:hypothetical protein [Clostridium intestinale]QLY79226.1 hypothetical protein HZF06_19475 [Clostridium intestinale]
MKYKKYAMVVLFLFSLLTFLNLYNLKCQGFQSLEGKFLENHKDVERTLIVEGKSYLNNRDFKDLIKSKMNSEFYGEKSLEENTTSFSYKILNELDDIQVDVYNDEKKSFRIIYSTKNKKENLEEVKKNINHLLEEVSYDVRYFKELKGRIDIQGDLEEVLDKELKAVGIKSYTSLKINNGYTGKAELANSTINFAICTYEKNSYMVIGEPLIVSTY